MREYTEGYNNALEDVEIILLKKFKFSGMPLIKEIKELKKKDNLKVVKSK